MNIEEMKSVVKHISKNERINRLMSYSETELHKFLAELYSRMLNDAMICITHGPDEFGKDIVIIQESKLCTHVTGVIVKKGTLNANTAGEIDSIKKHIRSLYELPNLGNRGIAEIVSQIEQTQEHDAEIALDMKKYKISKVIIVVFGKITANAKQRFQEVLKIGAEYHCIPWLIENFTEYYPDVFFNAELLGFISSRIVMVENNHFLAKKHINFTGYYVDPIITKYSFQKRLDQNTIPDLLKGKHLAFTDLLKMIESKKLVLIIGEPGTGKTGILNRLSLFYLGKASNQIVDCKGQPCEVPVYIRAKELLKYADAKDFINKQYNEINKACTINALLVDALDELPSESRIDAAKSAKSIAEEIGCALILTSRNLSCLHNIDDGFDKYELMPFDLQRAIQLAGRLYGQDNAKLKALTLIFEELYQQIQLPPLSLHLLMELVENSKEVPASITELYQKYFEMIFGRWDESKGLEIIFHFATINTYLSELAIHCFFLKGVLEINLDDFKTFNVEYSKRKGQQLNDLESFIDVIERTGTLKIDDTVAFGHRTFLDYFTGQYIFLNKEEFSKVFEYLANVYYDDIWSDVAFYYVGFEHQLKAGLIDAIMEKQTDEIDSMLYKLMTGRLLQAGWGSDQSIKVATLQKAVRYSYLCKKELDRLTEKVPNYETKYNDLIVLSLSEVSFGSFVLKDSVVQLLEENFRNVTSDNLYEILTYLWSIKRHLSDEQLSTYVGNINREIKQMELDETDIVISAIRFLEILSKADQKQHKKLAQDLSEIDKDSKAATRSFLVEKYSKRKHQ